MKFLFKNRIIEFTDERNARVLLPYDEGVCKADAEKISKLAYGESYVDVDGDKWKRVE